MPFLRKVAGICLALVGLLCVLYAGTWALLQTRQFRSWLEASVRDAGIELHLGKVDLVFPFDLVVSSARAALPDRFDFSSKEIRADVNPFALIFGQLESLTVVEPRIRVRLTSSSDSGEAPRINLLIRSFAVKNGQLEVETSNGTTVTIPRIELNAQKLDLGGQSGNIETVALIPELNGETRVSLTATATAIKTGFELVQHQRPGTRGTLAPQPTWKSKGELTLHFEEDASLRLSGHASLDRLAFGTIDYTGTLKLLATLDASRETVAFELEADTTQIAGFAPGKDLGPSFPFSSTITGRYNTQNDQLTLPAIRVNSPLGTLLGKADLSFAREPQLTSAVFEFRDVGLAQLQRLLPEPGNQAVGDINGKVTAKLTMTGQLTPWSLSGIFETTATQISTQDAKIRQIKGTVPFALRAGNFESTGLRLAADRLEWKPPDPWLEAAIASVGIKGDGQRGANDSASFNGAIEIQGGRFATKDGLSAAENIAGQASIQLRLQPAGLARAQLELKLKTMELLWGRFFADFKPQKPSLNLSATYDSRAQTVQIDKGDCSLENIGNLTFNGHITRIDHNPAFELRVETPKIELTNFYDFFIRETFKTSYPFLDKLRLAGTVGAETMLRGSAADFSVEGTAQLRRTEINRPDHWSIGPIAVTLPFKVQYPKGLALTPAPPLARAALAIRRVKFGDSEIPPFTVFLSLWNNTLALLKPLQIPLYGGALIVERLAWQDIVASPRNFSFSARINDISLAAMTRDQGWPEFNGTLSGVIPQVKWADDTLRTDGALELRAFDGEIKLDEIEVTTLGGLLPAIKGNVEFRGIDLARATKAFEFGSISGILAGRVEGLIISGGQPSQFRADFGTVEQSRVSQWISVEALNNITVLSSGAKGNAFYGTLAGFFKAYRYRKLGFKAQLRNDLLTLQGIKSQDGKEFLVEGSFMPPTVNVVSHTQRIGFKELMRRLERISQTDGSQQPTVR